MDPADRREHAREACLIGARLRSGTRIYEGTIVNLSESGLFVATSAPLEPDVPVHVRLRHPWNGESVLGRGVVARRIRLGEAGTVGVGIRLIDTLGALARGAGLEPGTSGVWKRPAQASQSGGWSIASEGAMPIGPDGEDRRRTGSRAPSGVLRVRFAVPGSTRLDGVLLDASRSGLAIRCDKPPDGGRLVRIELLLPIQGPTGRVKLTGRITWTRKVADMRGPTGFGAEVLHFGNAGDGERFVMLLDSLRAARAP
jgi:hypothetical protein